MSDNLPPMKLDEKYMAAVMQGYDAQTSADELLPAVLAQACVQVLDVMGAGLSITDELRVPLGASDGNVALAERLQTTLGEGPCLGATTSQEPVVADEATMAARWPMFHRELLKQTPFRSIASLPLTSLTHRRLGALDLYSSEPDAFLSASLDHINIAVADSIAAILFDSRAAVVTPGTVPSDWLRNPSITIRMNVWVAVGMLMDHAGLDNADALAALRGYAFCHETTLDDVANHMTTRQLSPDTLLN